MIAILDYGVGNLRSVYKAFETVAGPLGIPVDIVDRPTDLLQWRAVVLPGQGAFGDSVDNLRRQKLEQPAARRRARRTAVAGHLCRHADAL